MKIGFAITAYDKFEEAKILFEIIRKEFKNRYKISFCSNHPKGEKFAMQNDLDNYIQAKNIPFLGGNIHNPKDVRRLVSIVLRSTNSVQMSCVGAMEMEVDYIIHMHADAWVLNEIKLLELVKDLKRSGKFLAVRGCGLEYLGGDIPFGHVDDHFFVFEKKYFKRNKILDFHPEELWPHKNTIHGILGSVFIVKMGLRNIWYYRNTKDLLCYDDKILGYRGVKPSSYDPYYGFLHVHRGSFHNNFGKNIQAMYLKEAKFNNSEMINNFIKDNFIPKYKLIYSLQNHEKNLNKKIKIFLFSNDIIVRRDIMEKQNLINNTGLIIIMKNMIMRIILFFYKKIKSKRYPKINQMDIFYRDEIKLNNFIKDKWTKSIYLNKKLIQNKITKH